jgi:DNA-binding CsgD family transcriptional regulator
VSGFSPVTLSFLGLVFVVAMCLSILAVRRDHPDHVHTLWYVLSLTLCAVSVLLFYIYENSRAIQSTSLGGMTGTIAVTFMKASMDVREGIYILLTAGALLILPQILMSARQIAAELGIAETTVITRRSSAYARMGVANLRELLLA